MEVLQKKIRRTLNAINTNAQNKRKTAIRQGMSRTEFVEAACKDGSWNAAFLITFVLAFDCLTICKQNHSFYKAFQRSKGMLYE